MSMLELQGDANDFCTDEIINAGAGKKCRALLRLTDASLNVSFQG
jgi:hypothetical protein